MKRKILPVYWWIVDKPESGQLIHYGFDFRNKERDISSGLPNALFLISKFIPVLKKPDFLLDSLITSFRSNNICYSSEIFIDLNYSERDFIINMRPYDTILCGKSFIKLGTGLEGFLLERFYEEVYNDFGNSFNSAESMRLVEDWFSGLPYE